MAKIERLSDYEFLESGDVVSYRKGGARVLSPIRMGNYVGLQLARDDGLLEREYVHRLICEAFHGPCPDGMECRHLDGDRTNNSADNLAWGTKQENEDDKIGHESSLHGEKNPMAKLTQKEVDQMRRYREETADSYKKVGERFGVSTMTAFRAIKKESWRQK